MIKLTNSAVKHFKKILLNNQQAIGIKLGVRKSGCSGMTYTIDLALAAHNGKDETFTHDSLKLFVDQESLQFLGGLTLDCITEGVNTHIKFINPNATGECGCGESFSIK